MNPVNSVTTVTYQVRSNRNWFLLLGVISILLGLVAIIFPFFAALTIELMIGWILVISGVLGILHAWRTNRWHGFHLSPVSSLFALAIGLLLVIFPGSGIISLALLVALFFIASGIMRIAAAWRLKPMDRWIWLLFSGVTALILALLILLLWPEAAGWVVGILLGIDLLFSGAILVLLWLTARREV